MGERADEKQIGGEHYKNMAIQPTEFIYRNKLGWHEGNAIKYICRHKSKAGRKDLEKAIHYLELLLEIEYEDNNNDNDNDKRAGSGDVEGDSHVSSQQGDLFTEWRWRVSPVPEANAFGGSYYGPRQPLTRDSGGWRGVIGLPE